MKHYLLLCVVLLTGCAARHPYTSHPQPLATPHTRKPSQLNCKSITGSDWETAYIARTCPQVETAKPPVRSEERSP